MTYDPAEVKMRCNAKRHGNRWREIAAPLLSVEPEDERLPDMVPKIDAGPRNLRSPLLNVERGPYCDAIAGWGTDHKGRGRCRHHDGWFQLGPSNPSYVDGRSSRLPSILARIQERMGDPALTSLRRQLATCDEFEADAFESLDSLATTTSEGTVLRVVAKARRELHAAMTTKNPSHLIEAASLLDSVGTQAEAVGQRALVWGQLRLNSETRRRLASTETRREAVERDTLRQDVLAALAVQLGERVPAAIDEHVSRPEERRDLLVTMMRIFEGLLMGSSGGPQLPRPDNHARTVEVELAEVVS